LIVAIIGTGPSGEAALFSMLNRIEVEEIYVIDAGNNKNGESPKSSTKKSKIFSKPIFQNSRNLKNSMNLDIPSNLDIGGWSNIWGATFLPWSQSALINRFKNSEMNKHYESIGKIVQYQGEVDNLSACYKLFGQTTARSNVSPIAEFILEKTNNKFEEQFVLGKSRLAVKKLADESSEGCIQCGRCLTGCEYNHIYQSNKILEKNKRNKKIKIFYNCFVTKVYQNHKASIEYLSNNTQIEFLHNLDVVIIATGVIRTGKIIQDSFSFPNIYTKETPMVFLPGVYLGKHKLKESNNKFMSFSELFVQAKENMEGVESAGQIYSLNDQIQKMKIPFMLRVLIPKIIKKRIIIIMFFVKARNTGYIDLSTSTKPYQSFKYRKDVFMDEYQKIKKYFKLAGIKLFFNKKFIQPMGSSYHYAGLFVKNGGKFKSIVDVDGRILESKTNRIIIADASSLGSPEPGPITFTIMANSLRICSGLDLTNLK
jgi:hypothetical protein